MKGLSKNANFFVTLLAALLIFSPLSFAAPTEIILWHAMAGSLGEAVDTLAKEFNQSQTEYVLKPIYKGSYIETLTAYAAAYRAHVAPALVQVFEVGSATMQRPEGLIKPVSQLYQEQGVALDTTRFWPTVLEYYGKEGALHAMPFNISFPVMYYNASRIHDFPQTWQAFDALLVKLKAQGATCPYTSAYPSWIHIESYRALQGFSSSFQLKTHFARLKRWQKAQLFMYAGRLDEATTLFTSGKCLIFSQSSGAYQGLKEAARFKVGVALLPIEQETVRHANVVGGGALWVSQGRRLQEEKGILAFFQFFMQPAVQAKWVQRTGYLPILRPSYLPPRPSGERGRGEGLSAMISTEWHDTQTTKPAFAAHRIRGMNDEILELLFADLITVHEAVIRLSAVSEMASVRFKKNHGLV